MAEWRGDDGGNEERRGEGQQDQESTAKMAGLYRIREAGRREAKPSPWGGEVGIGGRVRRAGGATGTE